MPSLEPLMSVEVTLEFNSIGKTARGMRLNVPFSGTATSSLWEGERPVSGVDYLTVGSDGVPALDIRATVGEGEDVVAYSATGRSDGDGPMEVFTFETAGEALGDPSHWWSSSVMLVIHCESA
ncbi:MAG: DUF3237 domain-containing protein [Actinomycetia bacterium]|nr:DUF3237 domain-containing protein [Actinomycetes bacterium]